MVIVLQWVCFYIPLVSRGNRSPKIPIFIGSHALITFSSQICFFFYTIIRLFRFGNWTSYLIVIFMHVALYFSSLVNHTLFSCLWSKKKKKIDINDPDYYTLSQQKKKLLTCNLITSSIPTPLVIYIYIYISINISKFGSRHGITFFFGCCWASKHKNPMSYYLFIYKLYYN